MGKNFRETLNEQLRDPEFKAEWDALEPERQIMRAIVEGREERDLTQKQLAEVTGVPAPAPLAALAGKAVRFDQVVEKDRMVDQVFPRPQGHRPDNV